MNSIIKIPKYNFFFNGFELNSKDTDIKIFIIDSNFTRFSSCGAILSNNHVDKIAINDIDSESSTFTH